MRQFLQCSKHCYFFTFPPAGKKGQLRGFPAAQHLDYKREVEKKEDRADGQLDGCGAAGQQEMVDGEKAQRERHADADAADIVRDRHLAAADRPAHQHRAAVAGEAAPRARHIAVARHEDDVHGDHYRRADRAHHGAPPGLVAQLVPEREIEIDAHKDLGGHHYRYDPQARPILRLDEVTQQREIENDREISQERENDEIFHSVSKRLGAVSVTAAVEDNRLVGIAESLGEQRHYHRDLHAGSVDSELHLAFGARHEVREENFVRDLVQNTHEAQKQQRPGVLQQAFRKLSVETVAESLELRNEAQEDAGRADEIHEKYQTNTVILSDIESFERRKAVEEARHNEEHKEVQQHVRDDEAHLQQHKLHSLALQTQAAEHHCLERVHRHDHRHTGDVLRMRGIAHRARNRMQKDHHCGHKGQCDPANEPEDGPVNLTGVLAFLVRETEERGLHSHREQREEKGSVGVEVRDYAVAAAFRGNLVRIKGNEQIVQEPPDYAAQAVDGRIFQQ